MRRAAFLATVLSVGCIAAPAGAQSLDSGLKNPGFGAPQTPITVLPVPSARPPAPAAPRSPSGSDSVVIGGHGSVKGVGTINAAAGSNNQQANAGLIASGATALGFGSITQIIESTGDSGGQSARAALAPGAFAGSNGWLAVNGAAGADNQQANLAIMALGRESVIVSDLTLARTTASQEPMGENGAPASAPARSVALGSGAFKDSSGIVQLSLVGGDRNTTANTFALLVAGSAGN
jgi:hypothetical protein